MIGCGHHDDIARELVELHQQERNHAFNLAGLVRVAALFTNGVELVEKQYARRCSHVIEQFAQARVGLAEITTDKRVVSNHEEWKAQALGNRFGEGGLAIAGGPERRTR